MKSTSRSTPQASSRTQRNDRNDRNEDLANANASSSGTHDQDRPVIALFADDEVPEQPIAYDEAHWNEREELLPIGPQYSKALPQVKRDIVQIVTKGTKIFQSNPCTSEAASRLRTRLEAVQNTPSSERKMIALLGNAGQGM